MSLIHEQSQLSDSGLLDYQELAGQILAGERLTEDQALTILQSPDDQLLEVLAGAFRIRRLCPRSNSNLISIFVPVWAC